jgi:hypothetical protein
LSVVRILIWNLADSKTTLDELRGQLPDAAEDVTWFANEAAERFGLLATSDQRPDLARVRELIGQDPDVAEEYDAH